MKKSELRKIIKENYGRTNRYRTNPKQMRKPTPHYFYEKFELSLSGGYKVKGEIERNFVDYGSEDRYNNNPYKEGSKIESVSSQLLDSNMSIIGKRTLQKFELEKVGSSLEKVKEKVKEYWENEIPKI